MATITNDASSTYNFSGQGEVLNVNSNTNSIVLNNSQGVSLVKTK